MKIQEILRVLASQIEADERNRTPENPEELKQDAVMVPPLQQEIELSKAAVGKDSEVIDELTRSETYDGEVESEDHTKLIADLLKFAGLKAEQEQPEERQPNNLGMDNPAAVIVIPNNNSGN